MNSDGIKKTAAENQAYLQLFKDFLKNSAANNICPHCKSHQPTIKKEGHNKF